MPENLTSNQLSSEDAVALLRKHEGFILTHLNAQRLILFIERIQRQVDALRRERDMSASVAGRALTELHEKVTADEPPAVRRWDIRPAFGDGVDFLADPAGEWVKWEDVLPHLRTTQPPPAAPEKAAQALRECMESGYGVVVETVDALRLVKIIVREGNLGASQPPTEPLCPRPFTGRPDIFTMAQCILTGECGCTVAACEARKFQPPEEPTHIGDTEGMFRYFGASQPPAAAQQVIEAAIVWRRSPPSYHTTNQALRDAVDRYTSETKEELCSECRKPLPPLARWSMPACPECVEKAEAEKDRAGRNAYEKYCSELDIHCNRLPAWSELGQREKNEWIKAAHEKPECDCEGPQKIGPGYHAPYCATMAGTEFAKRYAPTDGKPAAPCCDINASYPDKHRGGCPGETSGGQS